MEKRLLHLWQPFKGQGGATVIIVALLMTFLIGVVSFAINIGYRHVTKNELQNIADGAALAAARQLGVIYQGVPAGDQPEYELNSAETTLIISVAQQVGSSNEAANKSINIESTDVQIGIWNPLAVPGLKFTVPSPLVRSNAVKVTARRETGTGNNGPITAFFSWAMGVDEIGVNAMAIAALTGQRVSEEGELEIPVGISRTWFPADPFDSCGDQIKMSPTNDPDACAGWHNFTGDANNNDIVETLEGLTAGNYESPATSVGDLDYFNYTNGDLATQPFARLLLLFKVKGSDVHEDGSWILVDGEKVNQATVAQGAVPLCVDDDKKVVECSAPNSTTTLAYYDNDSTMPRNKHAWDTTVVVYGADVNDGLDTCHPNSSNDLPIVGYARIHLTDVVGPPEDRVVGTIECGYVDAEDTRGGGGAGYGILASIPNLVQ